MSNARVVQWGPNLSRANCRKVAVAMEYGLDPELVKAVNK